MSRIQRPLFRPSPRGRSARQVERVSVADRCERDTAGPTEQTVVEGYHGAVGCALIDEEQHDTMRDGFFSMLVDSGA